MTDPANKSIFSRLDTSLMRSTKQPEAQKPANQQTIQPANQQTGKRSLYPKVTYHLCDEAIDAIEDAKRLLRREYHLKTSLEEIAEVAILAAYDDLLKNQQTSKLVHQLTRKQATQETRKLVSQEPRKPAM